MHSVEAGHEMPNTHRQHGIYRAGKRNKCVLQSTWYPTCGHVIYTPLSRDLSTPDVRKMGDVMMGTTRYEDQGHL